MTHFPLRARGFPSRAAALLTFCRFDATLPDALDSKGTPRRGFHTRAGGDSNTPKEPECYRARKEGTR